ncbi:hypothetical protein TorRG33x02_300470 [Trema orientale]|uniref:Uncharacterized protein n=1 Tax=Trema orientale TaxID=63057 RepID=A0A2P5C1V6_TREOI|nr:hypothetical protein TorRG33x02_300470 [Trema orientale]
MFLVGWWEERRSCFKACSFSVSPCNGFLVITEMPNDGLWGSADLSITPVISSEGRKVSLYGPWLKHGSKTEHYFAKIDEGDKLTMEGITHPVSVKESVTGGCSVAASVDLTIPENETTAAVRRRSATTVLNRVNREDHDIVSTPETHIPHVGKVATTDGASP